MEPETNQQNLLSVQIFHVQERNQTCEREGQIEELIRMRENDGRRETMKGKRYSECVCVRERKKR